MGNITKVYAEQVEDLDFVSEAEQPHQLHDPAIHTNVDPTPPAHGQTLVYDSGTGKYVHQAVAGGHDRGHSIHDPLDHTDVSGTPSHGDTLTWDSGLAKWVPGQTVVGAFLITSAGGLIYDSGGELVLRG